MFSFFMGAVALMPLISYFQLMEKLNSNPGSVEALLFTGSFVLMIFFGLQTVYLIMVGFGIGLLKQKKGFTEFILIRRKKK